MSEKLIQELQDLGSKLETPPSSNQDLLEVLKHATTVLSEMDQSPPASVSESMQPFLKAIVKPELIKHQDKDVKILVASCLCEITRITAPEAPYSDETLKDIFSLIIGTFSGLKDASDPSFERGVAILETLARYRSCVVILDLDCDDLVTEIFRSFISVARDDHLDNVLKSMETIMVVLLEESEDISDNILLALISALGRNKKDITEAGRNIAMSVIKHSTMKLEPAVKQLLISSMSGDTSASDAQIDYHEVIFDLYRCSPEILSGVVPHLTGELLADQSETRIRAVKLVGELFALPGQAISEPFLPILTEFLKRLTDRVVDVRMSVLDYIKSFLLSYSSRPESPQIFDALCDRLLDYDENVRKQVVAVICDVACHDLDSVPIETMKLVAERLRDKSFLVKKYTMDRLAEVFRHHCSRGDKGHGTEYDWIPGKILRCLYDKDFRSDAIEYFLCETMFPTEFTVKQRVGQWIKIFPGLDKVEVKALEKILEQKQRLQQEMQKYLLFKQTHKSDSDVSDSQKKGLLFFRVMARCFTDPINAEESFQVLDKLEDANIWKILSSFLDPDTSYGKACSNRDDILKTLGEKHQLLDFLSTLSVKCSYMLFNKEHVKEILFEVVEQKSSASPQDILSCMNTLSILARYSPLLFAGSEEELLNLLKEDDEIIKEGILHVLAMAGGTIRERLASSSTSVDLILERLCLEGSRRQAKYAVHALAAITKDDGLLSLSVLYKRLVDMLEERSHLPSVLQSLGCIAQSAMAVFETRESEIFEFIKSKFLQSSNKTKDKKKAVKARWKDRSDLCLLKIYGIKTLVKSYLPIKDAHLRGGIDGLVEILRNILSFGEVSKEIKSSSVDKAHLRLAAAKAVLRLSRHWDQKIPADVFHLTVRAIEINFPQARKLFRSKMHQYVKDRVLDAKYACSLLFSISGPKQEFEECKHDLADIIQMCRQVRARQLSMQSDVNCQMPYPEYILPYLVHSLAHHPSFPSVEGSKEVKAFERVYRILYLFLSAVVCGDEDDKSEVKAAEIEKESIFTVASVLHNIKQSVDVLDVEKSKKSYAICDLGLAIIKRLAKQPDLHLNATAAPVPLPSIMYKPVEKEDGIAEANETTTWLADESVSAHFESLKMEVNGTVPPKITEDDILEDSETDGNEMPLGKLIKHIKSQKVKARKALDDSSPSKGEKAEEDVDVLKVVREINFDGLGISNKLPSSNGNGIISGGKTTDYDEKETGKRKGGDEAIVPIPKRQRSSFMKSPSKKSVPRSMKGFGFTSLKDKVSVKEDHVPDESKLLVSCTEKKRKVPLADKDDEEVDMNEKPDLSNEKTVDLDNETKGSKCSKSPSGSSNKRKRRSIAGLSKNLAMDIGNHTTDLVDCKIKVWWPLDKKFYAGVVTSYDPEKKKHVVLYNDGEVEVLYLEKERWELISDGGKLSKKLKSSKSPQKGVLAEKMPKISDASLKKSNDRDTPKGKRTPKKDFKPKAKDVLKGSALTSLEAEHGSDLSDSEPALALDSGKAGAERVDEVQDLLPKKEEKSQSGDERERDDESKEGEEETRSDTEGGEQESESSDLRKSDLNEKKLEENDETSEEAEEADKGTTEDNLPPQSPESEDDEDEPICNWQRRLLKASKGK